MPVPAVYLRPLLCKSLKETFFYFFFKKKKREGKKKLGGEEERHNHKRHTHTADSAHAGEQAPPEPGHHTCTSTEDNKGTGHHGQAHR